MSTACALYTQESEVSKTTCLLPQCQGLQTYSSHHQGVRALGFQWCDSCIDQRLMGWTAELRRKVPSVWSHPIFSLPYTTPHFQPDVLLLEILLSSFKDLTQVVSVVSRSPLFHVLRWSLSYFYPHLTWRITNKAQAKCQNVLSDGHSDTHHSRG